MIIRMYKEWKLKRLSKIKEAEDKAEAWLQEKKEKADLIIKQETGFMTSSPCAVNNMEKCTKDCVHFKRGFTYESISISLDYEIPYIRSVSPKCRLWGD